MLSDSFKRKVSMSPFLITKDDVYKIDCRQGETRDIINGEFYWVKIFKDPSKPLATQRIGFTGTLFVTHKMSEEEKLNLAMKLGSSLFVHGLSQDRASVTSDNFKSIQGKKVDDEEIDSELMLLFTKFFKIQPKDKADITTCDLFVSTDFRIDDIRRRLMYLSNRGWIEPFPTGGYKITPEGFNEVESRKRVTDMSKSVDNRYFQVVPLSNKVKETFAFVLMPFKQQEFDQKVYFDVIKPTVEKELGICCIRSDEETKRGVINNQIFTMILKAKLIIAETTSSNPNVFYEVGMAHAFNKDVFIFNSSKNKKLPFDIITNRAVFYDDYEDLKKKLVENLKDYV